MAKKIAEQEMKKTKENFLRSDKDERSIDREIEYQERRKRELRELKAALQKQTASSDVLSARRLIVGVEEELRKVDVEIKRLKAAKKLAGKLNFDAAYSLGYKEKQAIEAYITEIREIDSQAEKFSKTVYKTGWFSERKDSRGEKVSRYAAAEANLVSQFLTRGGSISSLLEAQRQLDKKISQTKRGTVDRVRLA